MLPIAINDELVSANASKTIEKMTIRFKEELLLVNVVGWKLEGSGPNLKRMSFFDRLRKHDLKIQDFKFQAKF